MNAINNGKLEGWPENLQTEYVDSGSNVDPVHEAKNVFQHLMNDTGRSEQDCRSILEELKFTEVMMKGTIGELSGGWQMKLRLAKAVLIDADILLLGEFDFSLHILIRWPISEHTTTFAILRRADQPFGFKDG